MEVTNSESIQQMPHNEGMSQVKGALKYQGRKTSRANSEQRRRTILEAALRIVVRDGVRGVRHRAVAREAEVPLSATTYYFKDINDLITDTFTLFVEMGAEKFKAFWQESESRLQEALAILDGSDHAKKIFAVKMTDLAVDYVTVQLREHRDYLQAERAFQLECLRNENLRPVAFQHRAYLVSSLEALFKRIGSVDPENDARLFVAVMVEVEYEALLQQGESFNPSAVRTRLRRQIEMMVSA